MYVLAFTCFWPAADAGGDVAKREWKEVEDSGCRPLKGR